VDEHDYLITIRIPFKAMDDAQARIRARNLIDPSVPDDPGLTVKLQRLVDGKPPESVHI
jgi:hypothetical protein